MMIYIQPVFLLYTSLLFILGFMSACNGSHINGSFFYRDTNMDNLSCNETDIVMSIYDVTMLQCLTICHKSSQWCMSAFFKQDQNRCLICKEVWSTSLITEPGTAAIRKQCTDYMVLKVADDQLTSSSHWGDGHRANTARLDTVEDRIGRGSWVAAGNDTDPYIQVDFLEPRKVTGIVTQSRSTYYYFRMWVTQYRVLTSLDCDSWAFIPDTDGQPKLFPGNSEAETHVINALDIPVMARCVRVNPTAFKGVVSSMRFGILGCSL